MEEDIIDMLLDARECSDTLEITSEELKHWENLRKKDSSDLFDFIDENIEPHHKEYLKKLIEKYYQNIIESWDCENRLYYRAGFSDALKIILFRSNLKQLMLYYI